MTVIALLLVLYFGLGIGMWYLGLHDMGGKKEYQRYLKETQGYDSSMYYVLLVIFVVIWPAFFVKGNNGNDEQQ